MKNKDKTWSKFFCFVVFMKHAKNNTLNCFKKKTKKFTVFKEEVSEFRINGKDAMTMLDIDYLKRHRSSAVNGIFCSTCRTKSTVATKWNEFKSSTFTTKAIELLNYYVDGKWNI